MQLDPVALNAITILAMAAFLLAATCWPNNGVQTSHKVYTIITVILWLAFLGYKAMPIREQLHSGKTMVSTEPVKEEETEEERNIRDYGFVPRSQTIEWDEAKDHIGESVTVEAVIAEVANHTYGDGDMIFYLNMGHRYSKKNKNRFQAVIWSEDTELAGGDVRIDLTDPEAVEGKTVQIAGKVKQYMGVPEIKISRSSQVKVADANWDALGYNDD